LGVAGCEDISGIKDFTTLPAPKGDASADVNNDASETSVLESGTTADAAAIPDRAGDDAPSEQD
jgi:hypothetical protein